MKRSKKPVFFILLVLILLFTGLTFTGIRTQYGDIVTTWIKGFDDIRWGIDIRGGVDVVFTPEEGIDATDTEMDAAKSVIETRMIKKGITDYEIYVDYNSDRIIVRFPWQSGDTTFNPEEAVKELGATAMLTFREGTPSDIGEDETYEDLPLILSGADVESASAAYDTNEKKFVVQLNLLESGKEAFSEATKRLSSTYPKGYISIWMDENVISYPQVSTHIKEGKATISGNFNADSAKALADKINSGALPFKMVIDTLKTISPTQGAGARDAMILALGIAFLLISLFLIGYYRLPGVVAVIGLLGQVAGMVAAVTGFFTFNPSFTLTIPGIAGMILSVGMGVDANIITAERVKEELRSGKSLDGAISAGYDRAFTAIFDGNITLVITSVILMGAFGTPDSWANKILTPFFFMFGPSPAGEIFSFGYTLLVGVILNFVFGVVTSRLMTVSLSKFKALRNPVLYGGARND